MKLITKRNRWYFWRELFSYMIPMILIVGTIDVFVSFMRCSAHPEWSAPCSINWILASIYGFFLVITIILAFISTKKLKKVKEKIENEFLETARQMKKNAEEHTEDGDNSEEKNNDEVTDITTINKRSRPKKIL